MNNLCFSSYFSDEKVVLVYPGDGAVSMATMTGEQAVKIKKMVFIDSTWPQAKHIFKDPRLQGKTLSIFTIVVDDDVHSDGVVQAVGLLLLLS